MFYLWTPPHHLYSIFSLIQSDAGAIFTATSLSTLFNSVQTTPESTYQGHSHPLIPLPSLRRAQRKTKDRQLQ